MVAPPKEEGQIEPVKRFSLSKDGVPCINGTPMRRLDLEGAEEYAAPGIGVIMAENDDGIIMAIEMEQYLMGSPVLLIDKAGYASLKAWAEKKGKTIELPVFTLSNIKMGIDYDLAREIRPEGLALKSTQRLGLFEGDPVEFNCEGRKKAEFWMPDERLDFFALMRKAMEVNNANFPGIRISPDQLLGHLKTALKEWIEADKTGHQADTWRSAVLAEERSRSTPFVRR